jgi:hypothetical protein
VAAQPPVPRLADHFLRNLVVHRLNLNERANEPLKLLPHTLITAWRMGLVQGYYPNTIDGVMPWSTFARTFGVEPHALDARRNQFTCCPEASVPPRANGILNPNQSAELTSLRYGGFNLTAELIEDKIFDAARSENTFRTRFIRLVWVDPEGIRLTQNAVVFRFEDVRPVLLKAYTHHRGNDAAELSLAQVLDLRDFVTYPVEISGQPIYTLEQAQKRHQQHLQRQDGVQQNR